MLVVMIKILVDRSAFARAKVFQEASKRLPAGPFQSHLYAGIVPVKLKDVMFDSEQRGALLEIARLAKASRAAMFTSRLGYDEGFRVARLSAPWTELDIFKNVQVPLPEWAPLPFDFAKIPGFYGNDIHDTERYRRTLSTIMNPSWMGEIVKNNAFGFTDREIQNIRDVAPVLKLLGPNSDHVLDIFQLWTADVNKFEYFMTCDKKFVRYMTKSFNKSPFTARPMLPSEICNEQSILFKSLGPVDEDGFYSIGEAPLTRLIQAHDQGKPPPRARETQAE